MSGLAFEDKIKLITALQPEPLAALIGMCHILCIAAFEDTDLGVPSAMSKLSTLSRAHRNAVLSSKGTQLLLSRYDNQGSKGSVHQIHLMNHC